MSIRAASTVRRTVTRFAAAADGCVGRRERRDMLAGEEPLEIRVGSPGRTPIPVAVTMRTPGADFDLAAGFLFAEGLIGSGSDVVSIRYCVRTDRDGPQRYNVVQVNLRDGAPDPSAHLRNFYVSSSCGVCGKGSIEAVRALGCDPVRSDVRIDPAVLLALPERLRSAQSVFERTGGLHAAGLFDERGSLIRIREDVGRHNALDKLLGASLLAGDLPLDRRIVMASGRLSFELVQKASRAGAAVLAGVSAPSSLAVELADELGMTLIGFLRESRFNVYCGAERIDNTMIARDLGTPEVGGVG
jgi:FdhD protein